MLIVNRRFEVHCSIHSVSHVMRIMCENNIAIMSQKPFESKVNPDGPLQMIFTCFANEEDMDRFMDYFSKHPFPVVSVTY